MPSCIQIKDKSETGKIITIAPFRKDIRKTTPQKHNNYFEIIYLSTGSGCHNIDHHKYAITPPVMFFVRQEQVHYWEMNTEPDGYVIIIKKTFIEKSLDNELKSLLAKVSKQYCLQLIDKHTIEKILQLLAEEYKNDDKNAFHITEGLLKSLLAKVLQVSQPVINRAEFKPELYQSFIQLLSTENSIKNKVAFYAEKLHTSPQNLNSACYKAVSQPASEILAGFILNEAKRLLLYTDKSVSEISFKLNFNDASHFVKYFKKFTTNTPKSFRLNN